MRYKCFQHLFLMMIRDTKSSSVMSVQTAVHILLLQCVWILVTSFSLYLFQILLTLLLYVCVSSSINSHWFELWISRCRAVCFSPWNALGYPKSEETDKCVSKQNNVFWTQHWCWLKLLSISISMTSYLVAPEVFLVISKQREIPWMCDGVFCVWFIKHLT